MPQKKKSWQEKLLDSKGLPKVGKIEGRMTRCWGTGTMVIPAPLEVAEAMRTIRKGKLTTIDLIRESLAKKHKVSMACPLTTGIFAWISAHAADESEREGRSRVTPYWRTLKAKGELNAKYPGGIPNLIERLREEGHAVEQRGKRYFVKDYQDCLAKPAAAKATKS